MSQVHIKDEERIGCDAKIKLEPSVYLKKLYDSGTPDLEWMNQMGEWGVRAKPGNLGLRLKDIEIGSYGIIPEHGGAHRSMAPRGAVIPEDVPSLGFTINEKAECWADIAADAPTRWMGQMNHDFFEVKMFLATQAMDEARHMDVFRKRALANGGGLGKASALSELSLKKIFDAPSFSAQTGRLHLLGEGFVLTMFRQGEFIAPSRVDQEIFRRCMQDESHHVGYGTMHLRAQLKARPDLANEIHEQLDDAESILLQLFSVPESVEPMAILLGGGLKHFDEGMEMQANLWRRI